MGTRTRAVSEDSVSRFDLNAILVTLACFLGAAVCGSLLYQDIQGAAARTGKPLARLEDTENVVRLKPASSFVWGDAKTNEKLYLKDSIQTAPGGGASIRFNDGSVLELGENSLVVIDTLQNLSLNFLHGSAVVRTKDGDRSITVGKDGKAEVVQLPIRLIEPESLARYFAQAGGAKSVQFAWQLRAGTSVHPNGIEISSNRYFRGASTRNLPLTAGQNQFSLQLTPGRYFWRLSAEGKVLTEASQFRVEGIAPLKPLFPTGSQEVRLFGEKSTIQFRWVPSGDLGGRSHTRLEVAKDPQFNQIASSRSVAASLGEAAVSGFQPGPYYWRIESRYPGLTVQSPVEEFDVQKAASVKIALIQPVPQAQVDLKDPVRFSWNSKTDGVNFRWQVRPESSTQPLTQSKDSGDLIYQWKAPGAGSYQWNVQAIYHGQIVGQSEWRSFSVLAGKPIVLSTPASNQVYHYWNDPPRFDFSWSAVKGAKSYSLQVASNPGFTGALSGQSSGTRLSSSALPLGKLESGPLYWQVRAYDSAGRMIKLSPVGHFVYGVFPVLRAPVSASPDDGAKINPLKMAQDPVISWSPVADAQGYQLTLKQGDRVIWQQNIKQTQVDLKNLKPGNYEYSIRAVDPLQRVGEALNPRNFEITLGKPLSAPQAVSPEVQ